MSSPEVSSEEGHRCGFITLAGAPNVGKSTLLNRLIGERLAITSPRPQTTRNRIPGVLSREDYQLIFVDTPGLHQAERAINRYMNDVAREAIWETDLVALLVEAGVGPELEVGISELNRELLEALKGRSQRVFLILNKIDRIPTEQLLPVIDAWRSAYDFEEIVPISALKGHQVDHLEALFAAAMPEGPPLYPKDHLTDLPERFIAAELIREKLFRQLKRELPYASAVTIESWRELNQGRRVEIEAKIHVERDSQRGIVIGKGGQRLKEIGSAARRDLERLLDVKIHLSLQVRVEPGWTRSLGSMKKLGYEGGER